MAGKLLLGEGDEPEDRSGRRLPVSETSENCPVSKRTPSSLGVVSRLTQTGNRVLPLALACQNPLVGLVVTRAA